MVPIQVKKLHKKIFVPEIPWDIVAKNTFKTYGTSSAAVEKPDVNATKWDVFSQKSCGQNNEKNRTLFQAYPKKV